MLHIWHRVPSLSNASKEGFGKLNMMGSHIVPQVTTPQPITVRVNGVSSQDLPLWLEGVLRGAHNREDLMSCTEIARNIILVSVPTGP